MEISEGQWVFCEGHNYGPAKVKSVNNRNGVFHGIFLKDPNEDGSPCVADATESLFAIESIITDQQEIDRLEAELRGEIVSSQD